MSLSLPPGKPTTSKFTRRCGRFFTRRRFKKPRRPRPNDFYLSRGKPTRFKTRSFKLKKPLSKFPHLGGGRASRLGRFSFGPFFFFFGRRNRTGDFGKCQLRRGH